MSQMVPQNPKLRGVSSPTARKAPMRPCPTYTLSMAWALITFLLFSFGFWRKRHALRSPRPPETPSQFQFEFPKFRLKWINDAQQPKSQFGSWLSWGCSGGCGFGASKAGEDWGNRDGDAKAPAATASTSFFMPLSARLGLQVTWCC